MKKDNKQHIWLLYSEDKSGGEPLSDDRWCSYSDSYTEFHPKQLLVNEPETIYQELIEVDFEPIEHINDSVYLLVVRYSSGNTFGNSYGNWTIVECSLDKDKLIKTKGLIEADDRRYMLSSRKKSANVYTAPCGYNCWQGHFESLENVVIYEFTLGADYDSSIIKVT